MSSDQIRLWVETKASQCIVSRPNAAFAVSS
jgi:hypothetical protein